MKKHLSGFTLIELLIVVAIIAILAAIAVPNFLEAQTRAKVARVASDLRTMGTALEMYRIDYNKQPLDYAVSKGDPALVGKTSGNSVSGILHPGAVLANGNLRPGLTTPVSYITNCWIEDPFVGKGGGNINYDEQVYSYNPLWKGTLWGRSDTLIPSNYRNADYFEFYGGYRLGSIGPDRTFYNGAAFSTNRHSVNYDASNGTLSSGNIWRSQKDSVVTRRPPADY